MSAQETYVPRRCIEQLIVDAICFVASVLFLAIVIAHEYFEQQQVTQEAEQYIAHGREGI